MTRRLLPVSKRKLRLEFYLAIKLQHRFIRLRARAVMISCTIRTMSFEIVLPRRYSRKSESIMTHFLALLCLSPLSSRSYRSSSIATDGLASTPSTRVSISSNPDFPTIDRFVSDSCSLSDEREDYRWPTTRATVITAKIIVWNRRLLRNAGKPHVSSLACSIDVRVSSAPIEGHFGKVQPGLIWTSPLPVRPRTFSIRPPSLSCKVFLGGIPHDLNPSQSLFLLLRGETLVCL